MKEFHAQRKLFQNASPPCVLQNLPTAAVPVQARSTLARAWCSAVESILEVAFERHSAMVSLLYMMGVQTSTNAAFASVLYSVVAAAVLCTYRAGGEDFKYNVKVSLNFPHRPTNIFLTSLWDRTAATARTRARQGPGQEEAAKRKRLRPQDKRKRLLPQGKRKRLRPQGKRKRSRPQGKRGE